MAGRGRGRGSQFSAIQDSLGIGRERVENQSLNDPPPIYPPLSNRPHLPLKGQEHEYMLAVMKDFVNQMRDSQFALQKPSVKTIENKGIQIGRLNDKVENMTQKPLTGIDWKRYPKELAPRSSKAQKRSKIQPKLKASKKSIKTEDLLKKLEEAEKSDKVNEKDDDDKSEEEDNEEKDEEKEEDNEEEEMIIDEEMDDGTDYANNYFDNGEEYLDADEDNLDEGGIY
eukprot:01786.XXX_10771_12027_1 [CDS] Oithona nana genome sequencing.